jgi:hypothetical protein
MAARQIWLFLSDADVQWLLAELERREPGLVVSEGRYLRGEPRALLENPAVLERRAALAGERRLYLLHRKHSADVVAHVQPSGPFAGWSQIDEERTDCLVLRLSTSPGAPPSDLQPARLYAHTSFWRGAQKIRKRPMFALWANQTLRKVLGMLPKTAVEFMRVGPGALALAKEGKARLTYLYRPIAPEPVPDAPELVAPEGTVTEAGDPDTP